MRREIVKAVMRGMSLCQCGAASSSIFNGLQLEHPIFVWYNLRIGRTVVIYLRDLKTKL